MPNTQEKTVLSELKALAAWLERNAGSLANTFSDGCQSWSVEFESDFGLHGDYVPRIHIQADKVDKDAIFAAWSHDGEE